LTGSGRVMVFSKLGIFLNMIKFEHTLFALPFAYVGAFLTEMKIPSTHDLLYITLAMIGARTAAMSLNRIIDRRIDARNPRTAGRALPRGLLSASEVWLYVFLSFCLLLYSSYQLSPLAFRLFPVAVLVRENRLNFEKNILSLIEEHGFDGVNIDLEGVPAVDRSNYSTLLKELKAMLKPAGYLLTVSIPAKTRDNPLDNWNGAYDYAAIGEYADMVTLMTYDEHWAGGYPGPVASLSWVQQVLDYAVKSIPRGKILMGVAAYGYNWSSAGGCSTVLWNKADALASRNGGARWSDQYSAPYLIYYDQRGYRHEVWFENRFSLALKLDLANRYDLAGIAVWRLGFEDYSFWQTVAEKFSK
jgi:GH18 family chitinase